LSATLNILHSIPDVATIEQSQLQVYCDEWVKRPLAHKLGIAHFEVDRGKMLQIILAAKRAAVVGSDAYLPLDELVGYIIDQHFADPEERRRLHAQLREARNHWPEANNGFEAVVGRVGTLYIVCKNPACGVWMETAHKGVEGGVVECPPCELTCPACGQAGVYGGADLRLWFGANSSHCSHEQADAPRVAIVCRYFLSDRQRSRLRCNSRCPCLSSVASARWPA
jgi:hypothetical protein